MDIVERFLKYVAVDTQSVQPKPGEEQAHPSSEGQTVLAGMLKEEIRAMNLEVQEFRDGSFLVVLSATDEKFATVPHVVFAAHMDTYYGFSGKVTPKTHVYKGGDLVVNAEEGVVIPATDLTGLEGKKIITSDGTSLLGADDKAGLAAMMDVLGMLAEHSIPHGPLTFWFCVDEEIGELDITVIPEDVVKTWDILWTLDGERVGPVDVGCFICRKLDVVFKGMDAHPGVSGDKLKPAHYAATVFIAHMAEKPTPMETSGTEPFYYISNYEGTPSKATVTCMPRTFGMQESDEMTAVVRQAANDAAEIYGVEVEVTDKVLCHNTRPPIEANMHLVLPGISVLQSRGYEADLADVRGGTDGAMVNMTYPDLPAPNLGTGCGNLHGPQEFLVPEELRLLPELVIDMIGQYTGMAEE